MSERLPDHPIYPPARKKTSLAELVRAKRRSESTEYLAAPDVFGSDRELDEFLVFAYAERHAYTG